MLPKGCGPQRKVLQFSEIEGQAEPRVARRTRLSVSLKGWYFSKKKTKKHTTESFVLRSKFKYSAIQFKVTAEPDSSTGELHCFRILN